MQTTCQKCGHPNELGHLFCIKCGVKLELQNINEDIEENLEAERRYTALKAIAIFIVLVIIGLIVVAFWPGKAFDEETRKNGVEGRVEMALTAMRHIAGRPQGSLTTRPPLDQLDVNAWLAGKGAKTPAKSVSVRFENGEFVCRIVLKLGPFNIYDVVTIPELLFSFDMIGQPKGGDLNITGAKVGHLPLFGPLVQMIPDRMAGLFKKLDRERTIFDKLTDIQVEDGKLTLTVTGTP